MELDLAEGVLEGLGLTMADLEATGVDEHGLDLFHNALMSVTA